MIENVTLALRVVSTACLLAIAVSTSNIKPTMTYGEYMEMSRTSIKDANDKSPFVRAKCTIPETVDVKIKGQPVEVVPVRP